MRVREASITFGFKAEDNFDPEELYYNIDTIADITIRTIDGSPCAMSTLLSIAAHLGHRMDDVNLALWPSELESPQAELDIDLRSAFRTALEVIFPGTAFEDGDTVTVVPEHHIDGVLTGGTVSITIKGEQPEANYGFRHI